MEKNKKVLVGVSGGVDSTVTVMELQKQGFDVTAVYLKMKDFLDPRDLQRLNLLEQKNNIKVEILDCQKEFEERVISDFLAQYEAGLTPNPCAICNEGVKIRFLIEEADRRDIYHVATGHYARTLSTPSGPAIARALSSKDQSYMLYRIPKEWIPRLIFPLGELEKHHVKEKVKDAFGEGTEHGDSQDVCFVKGKTLEQYLRQKLPSGSFKEGKFLDVQGNILGRHQGLPFYTIGQRKGLGLSGGPWFVYAKDPQNNDIRLCREGQIQTDLIHFDRLSLHFPIEIGQRFLVQHRYRTPATFGTIVEYDGKKASVRLDEKTFGVAPGQSLVLYIDLILIGGGIIV